MCMVHFPLPLLHLGKCRVPIVQRLTKKIVQCVNVNVELPMNIHILCTRRIKIVNLYNPHYTWKFIVLVNGRIWKFISQFFYNTHDIFIDWKYIPVLVTIQNVFCCFFLCEVLFQCQYFMPKLTVTKKHAQPEYIRSFILVSVRH